ncbi:MAG: MazG nucleotide pyrophosphohydrolase domain-containing protein [Candidatus Dojkabacteria bacterium]
MPDKQVFKKSSTSIEIPEFLHDFYYNKDMNFSINKNYDQQLRNILALVLSSSSRKENLIDRAFKGIWNISNNFFDRWYKKYRKIDFTEEQYEKLLNSAVDKIGYTPFQVETAIVKFKLLHTLAELLEVYEVIEQNKHIPPFSYSVLNYEAREKLVEEISDLYISVLLTAKRASVNIEDIHEALEKKFKERN